MPAARGAVIQVETTSDAGGIAVACRLRNAITAANTDAPSGACPAGSGADTIDLQGLDGTIALNGALPAISSDATIRGPGADLLAVSGQDASQVFLIDGAAVVIRDVTIRDGFAAATGRGGAISVAGGSLVLSDCRITSSRAFNGAGVDGLDSTLRIDRCLIDGNETTGNSGAGVANVRGVLEINDSTIANNVAGVPDDAQTGTGGGVATFGEAGSPAVTRLNGTTLVANVAEGAANLSNGGTVTTLVSHTILGVPADGTSCDGTIGSDGYNIDEAGTCGLGDPTDRIGGAGLAFGLADNGGPTPTRALLPGSPAIDGGDPAGCLDTQGSPRSVDQRGSPRRTDGDSNGSFVCDIGAFETFGAPEPGPLGAAVAAGMALASVARRRNR